MGSGGLNWIVLVAMALGLAVLVSGPALRQASLRIRTILRCGWIAWHSGFSLRSLLLSPGLNTVSDVIRPATVRPTASRWPRAREPGPPAAESPPATLSKQLLRNPFDLR